MNIDLSTLLKDSLLLAGCSEQIMDNFDDNSVIMLEFNDYPNLYLHLDRQREEVSIWCPLFEVNEQMLSTHANTILQLLLKPFPYSAYEQNLLQVLDDHYVIKCVVDQLYLETPECFLEVLASFFDFISECIEAIK